MATGMKLQLSGVVVVRSPHRSYDRNIINTAANVRPPVADIDSTFTATSVSNLHGVDLSHHGSRFAAEVSHVPAVKLRINNRLAIGRFINRLAGVTVERWLGIERFQMTGSSIHEEPNHTFCPGRHRRNSSRKRSCFCRYSILLQQGPDRESGKTESTVCKKLSPEGGWAAL